MPMKTDGFIQRVVGVDLNPIAEIDLDDGFSGRSTVDSNDTALDSVKAREDSCHIPIEYNDATESGEDGSE